MSEMADLADLQVIATMGLIEATNQQHSSLTALGASMSSLAATIEVITAGFQGLINATITAQQVMVKLSADAMTHDQAFQALTSIITQSTANFDELRSSLLSATTASKTTVTPEPNAMDSFKNMIAPLFTKEGLGGAISGILEPLKTMAPGKGGFAAMGNVMKSMGKIGKGTWQAMGGAFSSMGPQMAMMALVLQPVMSLLNGLLEPFSIIADIFGIYGEILGQMFMPIIQAILPIMLSFIPLLQSLVAAFMPIINLFVSLISNGTMMGIIFGVLETVIKLLTPVINIVAGIFEAMEPILGLLEIPLSILKGIFESFEAPIQKLADWLGGLKDTFTDIGDAVGDWVSGAKETIQGWFD